MSRILILLGVLMMFVAGTEASVIGTTNITLSSGAPISDYLLNVFQDPAATDITGMGFNVSGQALSYVTETADEGSDWYLVSQGDAFSGASIAAGTFPVFVRTTSTGYESHNRTISSSDFYLGVNTSSGIGSANPPRDVFGWVHLQNDNGTLTILGNAVAYDEGGIVIGTTQAVPEPDGPALLLVAASSLGLATRHRRSHTENDLTPARALSSPPPPPACRFA